jgi:hypothetical protein
MPICNRCFGLCFKYLNAPIIIWEFLLLEIQRPCFNGFPDECLACPEYFETVQDQAAQLIFFAGMTYAPMVAKIVKECKRYHKRKVEYLK